MVPHRPSPVDPEISNDVAHEVHWAPLALLPPLAVATIFAMAGYVCFWLDVLN